jgi:hypothetical protein
LVKKNQCTGNALPGHRVMQKQSKAVQRVTIKVIA